jgi:uncharacterized protein (TIGR03435 family)
MKMSGLKLKWRYAFALVCVVLAIVTPVMPIYAQTPNQNGPSNGHIPVFDIVSIKPNKSETQMQETQPPDGFGVRAISLEELIALAYNGTPFLLDSLIENAPKWAKSERFDIEARVDSSEMDTMKAVNNEDYFAAMMRGAPTTRMLMLQALLRDHFKLMAHYQTKDLSVYALTVLKGKLKLKESDTTDVLKTGFRFSDGELTGSRMTLSILPPFLMMQLGKPVLDQTNLKGRYDFDLRWTPEDRSDEEAGANPPPGLFTAIQEELGLKLNATKGSAKVLVIDHVERPSEN